MSGRLEQDADGEENLEFPICCPHLVVSIRGPFWVPYCMIGKFNVDFTQGAEVNGPSVCRCRVGSQRRNREVDPPPSTVRRRTSCRLIKNGGSSHPLPLPILLKGLALSHAVARTASPGVGHPRSPHFPVRSPRALDEARHCPAPLPEDRSGVLGTWGRSPQGSSSCSYPRSPRHFPRRSCFKHGPAHRD